MFKNNEENFIKNMPKAELHVHLEGTMEPAQLLLFAQRNKINIPYMTLEQAQRAYHFSDYQSFIDAYIQVTRVLCTEQDFYDLTLAYLKKAHAQHVMHAEIFFDLQTYMPRALPAKTIVMGIHHAIEDAKKMFGISAAMIMCFIRHLSAENAHEALELLLPYKKYVIGVGLASTEKNNPPSKFVDVFARAKAYGFHRVAHAGECSAAMIRDSIELLDVERIDHGIHVLEDQNLVQEVIKKNIAFTVCPLSNVALGIVADVRNHPLKKMLDAGINVSIHSDDPAFFHGYIDENYETAFQKIGLLRDDLVRCARNSFASSFASEEQKAAWIKTLEDFCVNFRE